MLPFFLCRVRWRHCRPPNYEPQVFNTFVALWGRIASPIMDRFWYSFRHQICQRTGCSLRRIKRFVVSSLCGATRLANLRRKFSKTQKYRPHSNVPNTSYGYRTVEIVIKSIRVTGIRVTIILLVLHCLRGDAFGF